ncbi:hypothetical protein [Natrinema marinum]|uniref:hypothetical protein n=1 Tax=Natrinema marinum TaxID=2961598 RepID=UPI0020C8F302|nr:hypothetical protein [Natrinema marinum]
MGELDSARSSDADETAPMKQRRRAGRPDDFGRIEIDRDELAEYIENKSNFGD